MSSIVSGLAMDTKIFSVSFEDSFSDSESSIATFLAARSVISELTTQVTRISKTVPFSHTPPKKMPPMRTHSSTGTQPKTAAWIGPLIGPAPAMEEKW